MIPIINFDFKSNQEPEIIVISRYRIKDKNFETSYKLSHWHTLHLYFYHGKIRYLDKEIEIHPGDITITPAKLVTSYALEDFGIHLCMHFTFPTTDENGWELPFHISQSMMNIDIINSYLTLEKLFLHPDINGKKKAINSLLKTLIFQLYLEVKESRYSDLTIVNKLITTINNNLDKKISIEKLLQKYNLSYSQISRIFKKSQNMTISDYIMKQRIEKAKNLLKSSDLAIKEIASLVGYKNSQEFYKRFKQVELISPSKFKNL